jgi:threonine dehydratase
MSAAGPPQSANSAPSGGGAAAKPQAWGDHTSAHAAWQRTHAGPFRSPVTGLGLTEIESAAKRISGVAARTPLKPSPALSDRLRTDVFLKLETFQATGAFKLRGAANRLLALNERERRAGVVTVSTGNHGRAVAYMARRLGIRCVVCLSELVPANKIDAIASLGAEVDVCGADQDVALERACARAADEGLVMVSPFDDPFVIAGQGTLALEVLDQLPHTGTIIVPISGGGLAAGVALACKASGAKTRVVAISSERCAAMLRSLEAGRPIEVAEQPSLADSLGGGIGLDNRYTFPIVCDLVDEIQLVSDDEIAQALRFAFANERLVVEGAAAAPLAALLRAEVGELQGPIVAVMTGDNVDPTRLLQVLAAA